MSPFRVDSAGLWQPMSCAQWSSWGGIKNGELLARAANEFDALVTVDKNLEYQQNLRVSARRSSSRPESRLATMPT
jgi:hypothetical protein